MQLKSFFQKSAKAKAIYRAITHKLRQRIMEYLQEHPDTGVTTIYKHFRLEQSVASQQLAILGKAGLVSTEKTGKQIFYSLDESRLQEIDAVTEQLLK